MKNLAKQKGLPSDSEAYGEREKYFYFFCFLSLLVPFVSYLDSLAPTVTFEDSGELITAAYALGIPHEPGYPLFTMLGKIFSLIPWGNVAFRINLMSAVFSSLGILFLFLAVVSFVEELHCKDTLFRKSPLLFYFVSLLSSLIVAFSQAYLSQAIITEVYAINNFFVGLLLWLLMLWHRSSRQNELVAAERYFYLYALAAGLTLTNHHTSLIFIPFGVLFILLTNPSFLHNKQRILLGLVFIAIGLLPYLFLPIAASNHPAMNWGDPENWTNFWRVITRHQYGLDVTKPRGLNILLTQVGLHYQLLYEQFLVVGTGLGIIGLVSVFLRHRKFFYLTLVFNVFTGPLVAYITNIDLTIRDPFAIAEQKGLVVVMYLPFFMYWGILIASGAWLILEKIFVNFPKLWPVYITTLGILLFAFVLSRENLIKEDMSHYTYAENYASNLSRVVEPNAIVIANWDPFVFPMMYYQHVEERFAGTVFLDVELLRRTWYIQMLKGWYPSFMARSGKEVSEFIEAVTAFENGEKFDPNFIQSKYLSMINSFIDRNFSERPIYFAIYQPMRSLEAGIGPGYVLEPCFAASRLRKPSEPWSATEYRQLDFSPFQNSDVPKDRMAKMIQNYYAIQFAERAIGFESKNVHRAIELYQEALKLAEAPPIRNTIEQRYRMISNRQSAP